MNRRAFTLIELLVFAAIFSVVIIGIITIFIAVTNVQSRQLSSSDVETQGQFLIQEIQYYVQSARLIDMTVDATSTTLTLREAVGSSTFDPTTFTLASGTIYISQGVSSTPQAITSSKVLVSNLLFSRHYNLNGSSTAFGTDSVSYTFSVSKNTSSTSQMFTQAFESSATVLAPVPKIALIQQTSTATAGGGVSSLILSYPTNNEAGDLLVAVVANTTSSAVASISDTAGNSWTKIANPKYASYNQELTVFDAVKSANSSNTVTVSFGASVGSPSLFLYEYRGAATSTSFDASSTQIQTSTAAISSGLASPTSSVELLLSALYCNPSTGPIVAGSGFNVETSSSVSSAFVEDQDMYITGQVAGTWTYNGSAPSVTSSSAVLVTFK